MPWWVRAFLYRLFQTFRNSFYHEHLDRDTASESIAAWGSKLEFSHDIPPLQPAQEPSEGTYPVNDSEQKLRNFFYPLDLKRDCVDNNCDWIGALALQLPMFFFGPTIFRMMRESVFIWME